MSAEFVITGHGRPRIATERPRADIPRPRYTTASGDERVELGDHVVTVVTRDVEVDDAEEVEPAHEHCVLEEGRVLTPDERVLAYERDPVVATGRDAAGDHERLVLERPHLVVEHPLAAGLLRARVVDRRQLELVADGHARERVVGDGGADHRDHVLVGERAQRRRDRFRRAPRVAFGDLADQLDRGQRGARGRRRDLVDRALQRPACARAAVGLCHVVEDPDAHHARTLQGSVVLAAGRRDGGGDATRGCTSWRRRTT